MEFQEDRILQKLEFYKEAYDEFKLIFDITYDHISIADEKGVFLKVSKGTEKNFGVSEDKIIGSSAIDVEKIGLIDESMTAMVMKTSKKETALQTTATGRRFMVIGIPMFNEKGKLKRIINVAKDVTEIEKIKNRLKETEEQIEWYRREFQKKQEIENKLVYGETLEMKRVMTLVNQVANVNATVLLQGETGVGKTLIAKTIHNISKRRDKPFVHINCGAIPENLMESELFGYDEGAFTGASKLGKKGFFEIANHGTIFLDEIGEVPIHLQVKLLHALEHQEIYRVGGSSPIKVDVRILAATNKDLKNMVYEGNFREDLYYRLNVLPVKIPPLRDRKKDIPLLTYFFVEKYNKKHCMNKRLTSEAYDVLNSYDWPGNIRELENTIERLLITCDKDCIQGSYVYNTLGNFNEKYDIEVKNIMPLKEATTQVETQLLLKALEEYKTTRKIAQVLGIDQSTVVKKLKKIKNRK
ncbi:sigma-54 interaction domain-containing protein [Clostridiisalibacter paucivorans]|uniref:sigma-54 interaction domain-containing protein n=1 Tax=Clostridiisalibacter paucivorans TaxID=408753 RepID=UPI0006875ECE|nr:sigma 54-interacting transcriptional regulator [Clostridiisalibacter paucivorans]